MSSSRHRSLSRHATPTPSRPGTPLGSHRPPLRDRPSIPSLALAHASLVGAASAPQVSVNQAGFTDEQNGLLSSGASIVEGRVPSPNEILLTESHHGSTEHLIVVSGPDSSQFANENTLRPPEEVAADSQKLREQLRQSLSKSRAPSPVYTRRKSIPMHTKELEYTPTPAVKRQYFVLTHAGKPVFTSCEDTDSDDVTNRIGVMHALISVFEDDKDKIRSIMAPPVRITFTLRPPLYYVCVAPSQEPESVARICIEHLHLLILSVLTGSQLHRILTQHTNFDLRRLLSGTTTMLQTQLQRLPTSFSILTSSLDTLRLDPSVRIRVADALVPPPKMKSRLKKILYAIVVVDEKVVTIARPKKHTVHPADLHVLLATITSPAVKGSQASWLPICLPKFNSSGLLHAYASYLPTGSSTEASTTEHDDDPSICLVIVSASGDFESVRDWADAATERLKEEDMLSHLSKAAYKSRYSVDELGIPGLRHFFYKSRPNVQVTFPIFEGLELDSLGDSSEHTTDDWERVLSLYRVLWDGIHAKSGQECTLKLQYIRTDRVCVMGWGGLIQITQTFELYLALSATLPKSAAVSAANAVVKWVKQEEARLFLRDAPVF